MEFEILKYLKELPVGEKGDLVEFIRNNYPIIYSDEPMFAKLVIDQLYLNKLIDLWQEDYQVLGHQPGYFIDGESYLSPVYGFERFLNENKKITARITIAGKTYLGQRELNENQMLLNNSFKLLNETEIPNSNKRQRRLVIVSLAVAGISALFAAGSVWVGLSDKSATALQMIDTTLQRQSKILENLNKNLQNKDILKSADTLKIVQVKGR